MFEKALSNLSSLRPLRRIVLPILERFNPGDLRIRHHYTGRRLLLHSYRHKGYWFHGRRREQETMQFFQRVLRPGDTVVEVGGHIGYLTMWFAELVGKTGRVVVFEPGRNNLPYLRANVAELPSVQIIEAAVSDRDGTATFFEEELTGQNNSLVGDYERFEQNRRSAFSKQCYHDRDVLTVRLDTFLRERSLRPDLVKIDIEGAELMALAGATDVLADQLPMLMVEVTRRSAEVFRLLTGIGYRLFTPAGGPLLDAESVNDNVCALHSAKHQDRLPDWPWGNEQAAA
jgi:FkbM family methyltransferase